MNKMNKSLGFTLAETLVVIGLIGIVSALTLPNLNNSTGDKEQVVRVQKQQQVLTEAYGRARTKYGTNLRTWLTTDSTDTEASTRVAQRFMENMNIKKNCGTTANAGCFASSNVTYLNGGSTSSIDSQTSSHKFIANDGTSYAVFCTLVGRSGGMTSFLKKSGCYITIDIDGPQKGMNKIGKDIFRFSITGKSPNIFTSSLSAPMLGNVQGCREGDPLVCSAYILDNGNTNYPEYKNGVYLDVGSQVESNWKPSAIGNVCSSTVCPNN